MRTRYRRDGSTYYAVLYRHSGKKTSTSFDDFTLVHSKLPLREKLRRMRDRGFGPTA